MRVIARTVRPAARERVAAVDDWPVAVLSIAADRVAGVSGAALTLRRRSFCPPCAAEIAVEQKQEAQRKRRRAKREGHQ